jgi:hypothetical protein
MSLYTRLMGLSDPKISLHAWRSLLAERKRGKVTNQDVIDAFQLSAGEQTELTTLWGRINNDLITVDEVDDTLICAEHGLAVYDTEAKVKTRLGV